jgi:hypothetical protein
MFIAQKQMTERKHTIAGKHEWRNSKEYWRLEANSKSIVH